MSPRVRTAASLATPASQPRIERKHASALAHAAVLTPLDTHSNVKGDSLYISFGQTMSQEIHRTIDKYSLDSFATAILIDNISLGIKFNCDLSVGFDSVVTSVDISPDGTLIAAGADQVVAIFDARIGTKLYNMQVLNFEDRKGKKFVLSELAIPHFDTECRNFVRGVSFGYNGMYLAIGTEDRLLRVSEHQIQLGLGSYLMAESLSRSGTIRQGKFGLVKVMTRTYLGLPLPPMASSLPPQARIILCDCGMREPTNEQ